MEVSHRPRSESQPDVRRCEPELDEVICEMGAECRCRDASVRGVSSEVIEMDVRRAVISCEALAMMRSSESEGRTCTDVMGAEWPVIASLTFCEESKMRMAASYEPVTKYLEID